jgi:tetratricopeptide (TPR) repeat protein
LKYKATYFLTILLAILWISSCGVRRNNIVSKSFHNTTSYFNYHYNAQLKVQEGVQKINAAYRVPPEGFIPVWFAGTEEDAKTNGTVFENAIEICEIALQKHNQKDNKWIDNFRFIIGKAWFYKRNYILALSNFEWVIEKYPDSKLIPQVYMWMVKTHYMDDNPTQAAKLLEEHLKGAELNKRQKGEVALITAQIQLDQLKYDEVLRTLNANKDFIKGANNRARVSYLLGQIYQSQGQTEKAYDNYKAVTKINTDYELIFNAKLNMAKLLISDQEGIADAGKLMRLLKKMLRDEKNVDYKDRIYYEMAMLDIKNKDLKKAIEDLTKSIAANTDNQRQKALSYYKIGQIYFYDLKDFTHAQAYFDSASASINQDAPEYREISTISATLKEYIGYTRTIHLQDSLLELSKLSDKALEAYVTEYLEKEAKRKQEAEERALEEMKLNDPNLVNQFGEEPKKNGSGFYFDSPDQVNAGKVKFEQIWGTRKNEDNWRRKNKTSLQEGGDEEVAAVEVTEEEIKKYGSAEKARMIKNVPRTEDDKAVANQKVVEAMYGLAQVYHNKLKILDSAVVVYTRLVTRFPDTEFTLKSRYALYSIHKAAQEDDLADAQKRKICSDAPTSRYCKYCNNEAFEDKSKESMENFAGAYKALLETYQRKDFTTCIDFCNFIISQFPEDQGLAEVYMIQGKSYGSLGQKDSLVSVYTYTRTNYPDADVIPEVNRTLALLSGAPTDGGGSGDDKPKSGGTNDPRLQGFEPERKPHEKVYVVMLIQREKVTTTDLQQKINEFDSKYYGEKRLNVSVFLYQNTYHLPYISQFDSERDAISYLDAVMKDPTLSALFTQPQEKGVFISPNNFRTAYGKKRMEDYFLYYEQVLLPGLK